jgi:tetratricopeptide (TPR) repeat protein
MKLRRIIPVSVAVLVVIAVFVFAQDGQIVEKMPKSKNFDIPEDLSKDVKELLEECNKEMDARIEDRKNFKEHQKKFLKAAKKVTQKAKDCALGYFYLCVAHQGDGKDKLALKAIATGLKLKPDFYELDVEKADILRREEKEGEALKIYDKVIKEHPDYYYTYEAKMSLMAKQKKWKETLDLLNKILTHPRLKQTDKSLKEFKPLLESEVKGLNMPYKAEGKHYVVATDVSQSYADEILKHAELIYKAYDKVFKGKMKPGEKFPITIFANRQGYLNYGGSPQSGGFFSPRLGRVVFIKSGSMSTFTVTLYHELFHQFLAAQKVAMPMWFNEGHADFFGGWTYDEKNNCMVCKPNERRRKDIQTAIQRRQAVPLAQFLQMNRDEYYDRQTMGRNYAQGWSFVYFLWRAENGRYAKYVKKYYGLMKKKKYSLKELYNKVFRKDIGAIEASWRAFAARGSR